MEKEKKIISLLEKKIKDEMILNSFIRDIELKEKDNNLIYFMVNSKEAKEIIEQKYSHLFKESIEKVFGKSKKYKIVIKSDKLKYENNYNFKKNNLLPNKKFENYIQCDFNKEVYKMAKEIIKNPGKFSPLFISAKSGLGKTHILHSIGNEMVKNKVKTLFIDPNIFTKNIQIFSKKGGNHLNNYIEEINNYDFLLFDDIQNLGDRSVTLKVLFQIINNQIDRQKQIVITSDKVAEELSGFESRFITRFVSGISSNIKKPKTKDIIKILKFKLQQENINLNNWEKEALEFIARNNTSSIRALEGSIKRVIFFTEKETSMKYTQTVIKNIFKNLIIDPSELTPERILSVVADYYKINKKEIIGKSRKKEITIARHITLFLIRDLTELSYKEIGEKFGNRDYSTIISAVKKINKIMKINKSVELAVSTIENKIKSIN